MVYYPYHNINRSGKEGGIGMIRNEVTSAIAARRSIRKYTARPVTSEELETILDCGTLFRSPPRSPL